MDVFCNGFPFLRQHSPLTTVPVCVLMWVIRTSEADTSRAFTAYLITGPAQKQLVQITLIQNSYCCERLPLEYVQICVNYNPHMDTLTITCINVNASLGLVIEPASCFHPSCILQDQSGPRGGMQLDLRVWACIVGRHFSTFDWSTRQTKRAPHLEHNLHCTLPLVHNH